MENKPDIQDYKSELWYQDLLQLFEKGYCNPKKESIYSIFEACGKLGYTAGYRSFFNKDYIIKCGEYDRCMLNRIQCLLYFLEETNEKFRQYSELGRRDKPKPGFLKEWADTAFRYEILQQMIKEFHHFNKDFEQTTKIYVGTLDGWRVCTTKTEDPHEYVENVIFKINYTNDSYNSLGDSRILEIDHFLGIDWLLKGYYDKERHTRYDNGKNTDLRAYVNNINSIIALEWIEP